MCSPTPNVRLLKTESVELIPFINLKVVERPDQNKRYKAPHLNSMGIYAKNGIAT